MLDIDVLIVGAGQAGLAMARALTVAGISCVAVDRAARVGDSWRRRYDSLVLFTPRRYSALAGTAMAGDPEGFPTKDEMADYLEEYARTWRLPVRLGIGVISLEREEDGTFRAALSNGDVARARAVVVASGGFQVPLVGAFAARLPQRVAQIPAPSYRRATEVPDGPVLVVGDGATGRQIAMELAQTHPVALAGGKPRAAVPPRVLGRSIFWWLSVSGALWAGSDSAVGGLLRRRDPLPVRGLGVPDLRGAGVALYGRATAALGDRVLFDGGDVYTPRTVIWCLGYRDDTSWLRVAGAVGTRGEFAHERGAAPVPGLFHMGRPWQTSRASALVVGVDRDAALVSHSIRGLLSSVVVRSPRERSREAA